MLFASLLELFLSVQNLQAYDTLTYWERHLSVSMSLNCGTHPLRIKQSTVCVRNLSPPAGIGWRHLINLSTTSAPDQWGETFWSPRKWRTVVPNRCYPTSVLEMMWCLSHSHVCSVLMLVVLVILDGEYESSHKVLQALVRGIRWGAGTDLVSPL